MESRAARHGRPARRLSVFGFLSRDLVAAGSSAAARRGGGSIVFQLYPPSVAADETIEKWFYIDLTLTQLFDYYELRASVGRAIAADAMARERAATSGRGASSP